MKKHWIHQQLYFAIILSTSMLLFFAGQVVAQSSSTRKSERVVFQTVQFGRAFYDYAFAFEDLTRKSKSWVDLKAEETPGAMFILKSMKNDIGDMQAGKKPWSFSYGSVNTIRFISNGWEPLNKFTLPNIKAFATILCRINILVTFDDSIKSAKDLAGKRVAIATRAAPFNSTLKYLPYFEEGLKEDVNWQYIGIGQGKDALLNGTVDATVATFMGKYRMGADGVTLEIYQAAPDSVTIQLLASGRKLHLIPFDPQVLLSVYQGKGKMLLKPALIKAGAVEGIDQDTTGLVEFLYMIGDKDIPDDIITELIRVRYEQADKFGGYHAMFKMQPENPYPVGAPKEFIHPAVFKAANELGFKVIE